MINETIIRQAYAKISGLPNEEIDMEVDRTIHANENAFKDAIKKMATKADLREATRDMATKADVKEATRDMATKADVREATKNMATKDDIREIKADIKEIRADTKHMATKADVREATKNMATKADVREATKHMATKADVIVEIAKLEVKTEKTYRSIVMWMVGVGVAATGIVVTAVGLMVKFL